MPCVYVETSQLKDILAALPESPPHNWLITDLECDDNSGWDGCEKWAEQELFLTDEVQWKVWRKLFKENNIPVDDGKLRAVVMKEYNI